MKARLTPEERAERQRQSCRRNYQAHKAERQAYMRRYQYDHAREQEARMQAYYAKNIERLAEEQSYITRWREANGISKRGLSRMLGMSVTAVHYWETGRVPARWDKLAAVGCKQPKEEGDTK